MNLTSISQIRSLLQTLSVRPSKVLGQNFLIDANIRDIILDAAELNEEDRVLEVGPGLGVMTEKMLERVKQVTAVEKDIKLFEYLDISLGNRKNFELINHDATQLALHELNCNKVVSNLPYSVGSRIIMDLVKQTPRPELMITTVQMDVAHRLIGQPGNKDYGLLSIIPQIFYDVTKLRNITASCFYPAPTVRSSIVVFKRLEKPRIDIKNWDAFERMLKKAFGQRRKQLGAVIDAEDTGGINLTRRAEQLSIEEWGTLANAVLK